MYVVQWLIMPALAQSLLASPQPKHANQQRLASCLHPTYSDPDMSALALQESLALSPTQAPIAHEASCKQVVRLQRRCLLLLLAMDL